MASKCWFVLRQTHYAPPTFDPKGYGRIEGPICPGHLIPDLQHIDNVINVQGPVNIPPSMPLYRTRSWDLDWSIGQSIGTNFSGSFAIPVAAAANVLISPEAGVAFERSVHNYWAFESLDSFIFQPTRSYIDETLESDDVATYLKQRGLFKSSSLFMITGVIIARGARRTVSEGRQYGFHGAAGVEVPALAEASVNTQMAREAHNTSSAQKLTDFVWAVRLAKISKGILDRQWTHETVASGATFDVNDGETSADEVARILEKNGLGSLSVPKFGVGGDLFISAGAGKGNLQ